MNEDKLDELFNLLNSLQEEARSRAQAARDHYTPLIPEELPDTIEDLMQGCAVAWSHHAGAFALTPDGLRLIDFSWNMMVLCYTIGLQEGKLSTMLNEVNMEEENE